MLRFILRRLASGVVLVVVLTTVTFFLLYISSGNIARRILGDQATAATVEQKKEQLGLNRPLLDPVRRLGVERAPRQPRVVVVHRAAGRPGHHQPDAGHPVPGDRRDRPHRHHRGHPGCAGRDQAGLGDTSVQVLAVLGFAVPGFLIALGLVTVFAIKLGWFEPTGYTKFADSPSGWLSSITLPVIALAIGSIAGVTPQIRGSVIDALRQDYVRTLRSRGLSEKRVVYKHVLRNAGGPALSVLALQFVGLLGGAVIVEQIFALPGLGQIAVVATGQGDIPLVMGLVRHHRHHRRRREPPRRPVAGLAQPEGASVMSTSMPVGAVPERRDPRGERARLTVPPAAEEPDRGGLAGLPRARGAHRDLRPVARAARPEPRLRVTTCSTAAERAHSARGGQFRPRHLLPAARRHPHQRRRRRWSRSWSPPSSASPPA